MNKPNFFNRLFLVLVALGATALVFNSCGDDSDEPGSNGGGGNPNLTDPGVVINGVKWATRNLDTGGTFAVTPETPGARVVRLTVTRSAQVVLPKLYQTLIVLHTVVLY